MIFRLSEKLFKTIFVKGYNFSEFITNFEMATKSKNF